MQSEVLLDWRYHIERKCEQPVIMAESLYCRSLSSQEDFSSGTVVDCGHLEGHGQYVVY